MFILISIFGCSSPNTGTVIVRGPSNQSSGNATASQSQDATNLGANLDLQALGELVKSSSTAQDIENKLNIAGSINNLDLDGDGKVDYITVTEYGDANTKGFSFTVDLGDKGKQEVATVEVQKNANNQASMNIAGNQTVYGSGYNYSSNYSMTDLIILSYLWSPHSYYYSPYHYGYYPGYYHPYGCMSYNSYYSSRVRPYASSYRTTRTTTTTTTRTSTVKSPNSSMSSSTVSNRSRSLSNPTGSSRSYKSGSSSSSTPNTSGFSNKSSNSSSSRPSTSSSHTSSSRPSSSGSSHSFGGSSHSSSRGGRR